MISILLMTVLLSIGAVFAAQSIVDAWAEYHQPQPRFRPVTDEFEKAVKLLHKARFEVGKNLKAEINSFLTGAPKE